MKALGITLIIICFGINIAIGMFLYKKAFIDNPGQTFSEEELLKRPPQEFKYDTYGFSFTAPGRFLSDGGEATKGLVDILYFNETSDALSPVIHVYATLDQMDGSITKSEEYKKISKNDYENREPSFQFAYRDGGIMTNKNGIKMYYDTISANVPGLTPRVTEKKYTFFHKNNMYAVLWQDDEAGFDGTVAEFDQMIDTLKLY